MKFGEGSEFEGKAMDPGPIGPPRAGGKHCKDFINDLGPSCGHDVGMSECDVAGDIGSNRLELLI